MRTVGVFNLEKFTLNIELLSRDGSVGMQRKPNDDAFEALLTRKRGSVAR